MKRFAGYSLLALCALSLAGCGGGGGGESGGSSSGTPATSTQTPAPYSAAGLTHLHRLSITETIKPAQWFIDANALKKIGNIWHIGVTQRRRNSLFETDVPYYNYGSLGSSQAVAFNTMAGGFSSYVQGMGTPYIDLNGSIPFVSQSGTPPSGGTPQVYAYPADYAGASTPVAVGLARSKAIVRSFGTKLVVMDYQYNQGGSGGSPYMSVLDYPATPSNPTFPAPTLLYSSAQNWSQIFINTTHAFLNFDFDKFQDNVAFYAYLSRGDMLFPYQGGLATGHVHLLSHDGTIFSELATPLALNAVASTDGTLWTPYRIKLVQDGSDAAKPLIALIDEVNKNATVVRFDGTALSVVASGLALPTGFNTNSPMAARNGVLYVAVGANLYRSNATTFERLHSSIFDASQIISIGALSADANGVVVALSRNDAAYTLRYLIDVVQVP
jgi:hypothetical protein